MTVSRNSGSLLGTKLGFQLILSSQHSNGLNELLQTVQSGTHLPSFCPLTWLCVQFAFLQYRCICLEFIAVLESFGTFSAQ